MKKTLLFLTILLFTSLGLAQPQTEIQVRDITYQPAEPGDTIEIDVLVRNAGDSDATYQPLKVESTEHIEYKGTTSNFVDDFSLCGGCQTVGKVYLKVKDDASSGSYPLDIIVRNKEDIGVVEKTKIEVDSRPNIITTGQVKVKQGETKQFDLGLENIGKDKATQVTVSLKHPKMNFNPSTVLYKNLNPEESDVQTITVNTDNNLDSGPHTAQAMIEYVDNGNQIIQNRSIPVQVLKDVELTVSEVKTEDAVQDSESRIMVELENTGNSKAESINSQLECENVIHMDNQDFVGSIDSDESIPTVYKIIPKQKSTKCHLSVDYVGEENQNLKESFTFTAERDSNLGIPLAVLVLVISGLIYYRRKRQDR